VAIQQVDAGEGEAVSVPEIVIVFTLCGSK
jgi:hypothetical protein